MGSKNLPSGEPFDHSILSFRFLYAWHMPHARAMHVCSQHALPSQQSLLVSRADPLSASQKSSAPVHISPTLPSKSSHTECLIITMFYVLAFLTNQLSLAIVFSVTNPAVFLIKSKEIQQNFTVILYIELLSDLFSMKSGEVQYRIFSVENSAGCWIKSKEVQQNFSSVLIHMLFFSVSVEENRQIFQSSLVKY